TTFWVVVAVVVRRRLSAVVPALVTIWSPCASIIQDSCHDPPADLPPIPRQFSSSNRRLAWLTPSCCSRDPAVSCCSHALSPRCCRRQPQYVIVSAYGDFFRHHDDLSQLYRRRLGAFGFRRPV